MIKRMKLRNLLKTGKTLNLADVTEEPAYVTELLGKKSR